MRRLLRDQVLGSISGARTSDQEIACIRQVLSGFNSSSDGTVSRSFSESKSPKRGLMLEDILTQPHKGYVDETDFS